MMLHNEREQMFDDLEKGGRKKGKVMLYNKTDSTRKNSTLEGPLQQKHLAQVR